MTLTVAVLGANGFIGSRLVEMFHLARLANVRPVVRSYSSLARLSRFQLDPAIADAFDETALRTAFEGANVVVHAIAGDPKTIVETIAPVYRAAEVAGVRRLVYLSSASVHGQAPPSNTDETSPLSDRQEISYNNAKVQAEQKLRALRAGGTVEIVILRPGIVFGPRSYWVTSFAEALINGQAYLFNRGQGICNSLYVDNLVHAIYQAATTPGLDNEAFLVGDQERATWAELYAPIAQALGFALASVPEAAPPAPEESSPLGKFDAIRTSKPAQVVLSAFPMKWRQAAFMGLTYLHQQPPEESPWSLPLPSQPVASREMMLLYQCQYKLPHTKAEKMFGYQPVVSFAEGCDRTVAWLDFAGYPVNPQRQL
jgi:nucleoside-diphosphate-sugar epimerase